ncbi:hypothetical protein [Nonomuraea sp. NPDC002799]
MEVESSICLSDLVPALRWSRPQQVAEALGDPRLPAAWWSSLALSKALGTAGLDWICERLARLAAARWDHLPLDDLLPALAVHHIDPTLPGWPESTRTAVIGLGGWQRLRRLSPSDLSTPSATPEVVIGSVFREILGRIPAQREAPAAARSGHPEATRPLQRGSLTEGPPAGPFGGPSGAFPVQTESPGQRQPIGPFANQGPSTGMFSAQPAEGTERRQTGAFPAQHPEPRQTGSFPAVPPEGGEQRPPGLFPPVPSEGGEQRPPGLFPAANSEHRQTGSFQAPNSEHRQTGSFPAPHSEPRQTGSFPAVRPENGQQRQTGSFPAQSGAFEAQPQSGPRQSFAGEGLPQRPAPGSPPERLPQRPGSPLPGRQDPTSAPGSAAPGSPGTPVAGTPGTTPPGGPTSGPGSSGLGTSGPGGSGPGKLGSGGPHTGSFPAIPGGPHTGSFPAVPGGPHTGSIPAVPGADNGQGPANATGGLPAYPAPAPAAATPPAALTDTDHAMVRVVDNLFRSLDKLELAVAVHRLFAEDPVSLRTLAHKMLVERDALSQAQRTAEERILQWLRSSESAPVTGHMFRLTEWLGAAATEDQLIGADPAHPVAVPSLRTPLWRVLVTLMPDRRLQDGWLVVGDIHGLQARTRQLLATSQADADLAVLMAELGIRAHSAKAWLDALPSETGPDPVASSPSPAQPLPRRTPGANGHHHRGGAPIPAAAAANSIDPSAALATLSALSGGRSGMLAGAPATPPPPLPSPSSDPRRWQRIEVTPEHLRGGPVPVPEGYAAQLGMRPGTLLSVTGPGDNAIVLVWQGHQPVFDSLQPVLMRLNARPGDQVYVTVDGYRLEAQLTG